MRRDGLEDCRACAAERTLCASGQCDRRGVATRVHSGRTLSVAACRLPCPRAFPPPLSLRPMCHTHCACYSMSRQSAELCCCSHATPESPKCTAAVSNHVRVRPMPLEQREQRCSERAAVARWAALATALAPSSVLLGYSPAHRSCAPPFWSQVAIFGVLDISCSSYARASAGARRSVVVVTDASGARVVLASRTRVMVYCCAGRSHDCRRLRDRNQCTERRFGVIETCSAARSSLVQRSGRVRGAYSRTTE